jgi:hypothetical protein
MLMTSEYIDLGTGKWRKKWISKQHIVECGAEELGGPQDAGQVTADR